MFTEYQHIPAHNPIIRVDVGFRGRVEEERIHGYEEKDFPVGYNDAETLDMMSNAIMQDVIIAFELVRPLR